MKTYILAYSIGDADFTCRIEAENWDDAERRLKAIAATGRVVGEWVQDVPEQEPVAVVKAEMMGMRAHIIGEVSVGDLLYKAAPQPQREWVGLTDAEVADCIKFPGRSLVARDGTTSQRIARAIEAKLREKNGGGV